MHPHPHKNELTTETYGTKICEFVKHEETQDQKLKTSRASTQPTYVQSWACPSHLLEFAVSDYLAKAFVIYVLSGRDLGAKAESCSTTSVLRNHLTFESWDFASGPTLIPPGEPKTRVKYSYKDDMTTIGRNHQEQRMHHFHTTTTFFTDHSSLLLFDNVMAEITSGLERVRGTLLFYREISSHVKSKLEKSISHVYHVLPIITISAVVYNCTLTNIAYDRIYRIPDSPSNVLSFIPPHTNYVRQQGCIHIHSHRLYIHWIPQRSDFVPLSKD